jgi:hypothetical protein
VSTHSPTDDLRDLRAVFSPETDMDAAERAVMGVLILHRNGQSGRTDPSVTTIAAEAGISRRTAMRALASLEGRSHIARDRRSGLRNRYVLHPTTSAIQSPVPHGHQCQPDTGPVPPSHRTRATVAPERTKERAKERSLAETELWPRYVKALDGSHLHLTASRRDKLDALHAEQLKNAPDPLALFTAVLRAVRASEWHMKDRAYQMPESLFKNPERREQWAEKGRALLNGKAAPGGTHDPLMLTQAELRGRT